MSSKTRKISRGRKIARKTKSTLMWEGKFIPILKKYHGTRTQGVFHRLMKKSSSLRSALKKRSKEYEVQFDITLIELRHMILKAYGRKCCYCKDKLLVKNMVCDHKVPLSCGGPSTQDNLEMICKRCNTRKGPLTAKEYRVLVLWLKKQSKHFRDYINRKLSGRDPFNG